MYVNKLEIFYEDIQPLKLSKLRLKKYIKFLINSELRTFGEISIILCSDSYLFEMNKQYLNHDYYTDIITFDYVENNIVSGDLFISIDRIAENAIMFETEQITELVRVIFHGVLHLVGYGDKTDEEKRLMRERENLYLSEVDFKGLEI